MVLRLQPVEHTREGNRLADVIESADPGNHAGTVKDASGAVIPRAAVTLKDEGTGLTLSTRTRSDGSYIFTPIKIGQYTVTTSVQGFETASHPHTSQSTFASR